MNSGDWKLSNIFLGKVDYKAFAHLITTGAQEELAQA